MKISVHLQLAVCFFAMAGLAAAQTFTELPGSPLKTGPAPAAVVSGNFFDSLTTDLAVANRDGNSVTILKQVRQRGTFYTYAPGNLNTYPVGAGPVSLTAADFDSNGLLDLAVANSDGTVTILLATYAPFNGALVFVQPLGSPIRTSLFQSSIASGDFNGDGKPDLAVTNQVANTVTILLGDGVGGFTPAPGSPFPAGSDPRFVLTADFNADGKPDLAIANGFSGTVTILLGNGSGSFSPAPGGPVSVGTLPRSLSLGDFNKDGKFDLAVANQGSNNVSVLLGDGRGGFTTAPGSPIAAGNSPVSAVIADFAHHGNLDIAVVSGTGNAVSFLLGDGKGGFSTGNSYATGASPVMAAVLEINGDGLLDLAVLNQVGGSVTLLLNGSDGAPIWTFFDVGQIPVFFFPGQNGLTLSYGMANRGNLPTAGIVTATYIPPPGFTTVAMSGNGWACLNSACTRSDSLSPGSLYPPIAITVNVGLNIIAYNVMNQFSISGGGAAGSTRTDLAYASPTNGVYISSVPVAVPVTLDGALSTTPLTLALNTGRHTVAAPAVVAGIPGVQYAFSMWGNNAFPLKPSLDVDTALGANTFTAFYATQYQLTAKVAPAAAGTVSVASGGYYNAGTPVPVSVTPSSTFQFSNWTGGVASPSLASTSVTMPGPLTITANLIPTSPFFVRQIYRDLLSRDPDAGGFAYWTGLIDAGTLTRSVVASSLFTSPEFTQSGLYVIKLYVGILGRDPDFGGWFNWVAALRNGATPAAVLNAFLASAEFQNTYGSLSNSDFVNLVYRNVLQRPPDPGGLANWLGQLNGGQLSRGAMMAAFVNGPEFDNLIRPRAYANLCYMGFLRRTPDGDGLTYWTGILASGNPLASVIYGFINGPEYLNRLASITP